MKAVRAVVQLLKEGGVKYIFGIPAGSVNAFFDELMDVPQIEPIIAKHEGAAAYMAAAYAKHSKSLGVCIGCSGPGSTNLITGAANAMREHLPVLFLTGSVPRRTVGLNASQELDAVPLFAPVTKYSVSVQDPERLGIEVAKAIQIAQSGIPGPVHVAMPIDVQLSDVTSQAALSYPHSQPLVPEEQVIQYAATELIKHKNGFIFVGQGARHAMTELIHLAEMLNWPFVTTPQAKGLYPDTHPLHHGVFGFAGDEQASNLIQDPGRDAILIVGSSLGETATSNWNRQLTENRYVVQIDNDSSVFNRVYPVKTAIHGDATLSLDAIIFELEQMGYKHKPYPLRAKEKPEVTYSELPYNTQNVLTTIQDSLPKSTRYTVDIGEFMSYVIHYMSVKSANSFDINVHFGAMGTAFGSAIGWSLAQPDRPMVCITGDGCFFMHGMEVLTAIEYKLPIVFVVMNNARLGMVYHGHNLQYKRSHPRFEQAPISISDMARGMGIPSARVDNMEQLHAWCEQHKAYKGPSIIEVALVDNNVPPMGDRVKFLSSFQR
ncbi:thiamine pyrophosphate-binding protein [Paenibacillus sp. N1-5-1-14]|uniref:thiamine pyrophosphate-binding protein n=1 Tax=Paenibacillus radicibacter TaxID=2972488 RepID=UPI0021597887|nr:thiamine pyrophosphate-binding protein [Paenibacillus radicibacter]MCR8644207.1 thiamine pyrophosphate-binding protein [Paenibacillus radicibacter]